MKSFTPELVFADLIGELAQLLYALERLFVERFTLQFERRPYGSSYDLTR
jgi:hypothetical protein